MDKRDLLYKEIMGTITHEEKEYLNKLIEKDSRYEKIIKDASNIKNIRKKYNQYNSIDLDTQWNRNKRKRGNLKVLILKTISIAAIFVLTSFIVYKQLSIGNLRFKYDNISEGVKHDQMLGFNSHVKLSVEEKILPIKDDDDINTYIEKTISTKKNIAENITISVDKGSKFKFTLPDGSICHLNSDSKIIYPSFFSSNSREVFIEGEAYLEVVKDSLVPFVVNCGKYNIRVLGTAFNVKNYSNEESSQVTLVNGSIQIGSDDYKYIIEPSQQVIIDNNNSVNIKTVDTSLYTSWMSDKLLFRDIPLIELLNILSRRYNVDFYFRDEAIKYRKFSGALPFFNEVMDAILLLQKTSDIKFVIDFDNKIEVSLDKNN